MDIRVDFAVEEFRKELRAQRLLSKAQERTLKAIRRMSPGQIAEYAKITEAMRMKEDAR
jgi:O6-methylguanine-DNA--protein-cysteine methyltransferase